ncbi:group III truncated hemoglobin [Persicobacter diffluens]|uniref:Globin n=1 Tax=Persicobacter diffluens TaxID=981 RepID=A0AAN5AKX2_9BACT|nr:hypothetical protein PEDI_31710 [Persicobacter diffluens]
MEKPKTDLSGREDIEQLMAYFYGLVFKDPQIGPFFTEHRKVKLEEHLPRISDFWESILFPPAAYRGNPVKVHLEIDAVHKLEKNHFDTWLKLFLQAVDTHFTGNKAELLKQRAQSIATIMQIKIHQNGV